VIELQGVRKVFRDPQGRDVVAVDDVSFSVRRGETLCLIGPSGCGKTTTLKLINRLLEPGEGTIFVGGEDVALSDVISLRRRIGYVVQSGGLFPHMTVAGNVGLLCELEGWPRERTRARIEELLELVNLPPDEFADRYPSEISGGQRQRVGVARALALDPESILMDEPFGALDPVTRDQIHVEFERLESIVRKTIVMVTHDMFEAFRLGDRVALMDEGRLVQIGTEEDFRERPASPVVTEFLRKHMHEGD
jgi:osmoprotectant transport system ATP-binding protein